jgi:hypothetical protein
MGTVGYTYNGPLIASCSLTDPVIDLSGVSYDGVNLVTGIDSSAFQNTTTLVSINIPTNILTIGDFAFFNCSSLTSINLPTELQSLGINLFQGCTSLTSLVFPPNILNVPNAFCQGCSSLVSFKFTGPITSINNSAFYYCASLKSITLPVSLYEIQNRAFSNSGLVSIAIPAYVYLIGASVFSECSSLRLVQFLGDRPSFLDSDMLNGTNIQHIYFNLGTLGWPGDRIGVITPEPITNLQANTRSLPTLQNGNRSPTDLADYRVGQTLVANVNDVLTNTPTVVPRFASGADYIRYKKTLINISSTPSKI